MNIREEQVGRIRILIPVGDLDITALPAFEARVDQLMSEGALFLLWDLEDVSMLPSTAAGFLLQTARRVRAAGGRLALAGARPLVRSTLDIMGVLEFLPTYAGREEALAAFDE